MKIISTKEYNKLMKMKSDYLDLLWKPLQGVFEKVTDDDLLRENGLLNAENERLNNIINELEKYLWEERYNHQGQYVPTGGRKVEEVYTMILDKIEELKGVDKEWKK